MEDIKKQQEEFDAEVKRHTDNLLQRVLDLKKKRDQEIDRHNQAIGIAEKRYGNALEAQKKLKIDRDKEFKKLKGV